MTIVDTNIILRYLLNDNEEMNKVATEIIENNEIFIPTEVIVEASYVLNKVYNVEKNDILNVVQQLLNMEGIVFQNKETIELAFKTYSKKNLDIVDCILFAYYKNEHLEVKTFDKKLAKLIKDN